MFIIPGLSQEFDNGKILDFKGNKCELNPLRKYQHVYIGEKLTH